MIPQRVKNPIIPGSKKDRTGSAGLMRRAVAEINRRFAGLQSDVLATFDKIRVYGLNDAAQVMYGLTPDELAAVSTALGEAVDRWISEGEKTAYRFWWAPFSAEAAHLGAAQSVMNLSGIAPSYAAARSLQAVVYSDAYKSRVAVAQIKSYDSWKALGERARADLSQIIGRAVVDGQSPKAARKAIAESLNVSKSRAMLYAQTDITETLREARWAEADYATEEYGLNIGLLWTSALLPTTRSSHAIRNGKVYTSEQVRTFYGKDGNKFRCHCGQTECLLDKDSRPILSDALKKSMQAERQAWEKDAAP